MLRTAGRLLVWVVVSLAGISLASSIHGFTGQRGGGPPPGMPNDAPWIDRIRQQPDDITGYLALSSMYYMTRRYDDAERFLMGALTLVRKRGAAAAAQAAGAFLVEGFVQRPGDARPTGRRTQLFVNGRPFRDPFLVLVPLRPREALRPRLAPSVRLSLVLVFLAHGLRFRF